MQLHGSLACRLSYNLQLGLACLFNFLATWVFSTQIVSCVVLLPPFCIVWGCILFSFFIHFAHVFSSASATRSYTRLSFIMVCQ